MNRAVVKVALFLVTLGVPISGCQSGTLPPASTQETPKKQAQARPTPKAKPKSHREKAFALHAAKKRPEAIREYKLALHQNSKDPELHYGLACLLQQKEVEDVLPNRSQAYDHFRRALKAGLSGERATYARSFMRAADQRQEAKKLAAARQAEQDRREQTNAVLVSQLIAAVQAKSSEMEQLAYAEDWDFLDDFDLSKTPDCPRDEKWYPIKKYVVERTALAKRLADMGGTRAFAYLDSAAQQGDLIVVMGAYSYYLARGGAGAEPVLLQMLEEFGEPGIAFGFYKGGNDRLKKAGEKWLYRKGYQISHF